MSAKDKPVSIRTIQTNIYGSGRPYIGIAKPPDRSKKVTVMGWDTCRERLINVVCTQIRNHYEHRAKLKKLKAEEAKIKKTDTKALAVSKTKITSIKRSISRGIPVDKTRIAVSWPGDRNVNTLLKHVKDSQRLINIIEEHVGWELSTFNTVSNGDRAYLFTGSKKWMRSTHAFSLYCLLWRIIGTHGDLSKVKTFDQLEKKINKGLIQSGYSGNTLSDIKHMNRLGKGKLRAFIENIDPLYKGRTHKDTFTKNKIMSHGSIGCEGIAKLADGCASDTRTKGRFAKIWAGAK